MRNTSTTLTWVYLSVLILLPVLAVGIMLGIDFEGNQGLGAAFLAANAGTALLIGLVFNHPDYKDRVPTNLTFLVLLAGGASGLLSAVLWIMSATDNVYLPLVLVVPLLGILTVLIEFIKRADKAVAGDDVK